MTLVPLQLCRTVSPFFVPRGFELKGSGGPIVKGFENPLPPGQVVSTLTSEAFVSLKFSEVGDLAGRVRRFRTFQQQQTLRPSGMVCLT
jgi:hypothetical protein